MIWGAHPYFLETPTSQEQLWITSKGDLQNHPRSWADSSQRSGAPNESAQKTWIWGFWVGYGRTLQFYPNESFLNFWLTRLFSMRMISRTVPSACRFPLAKKSPISWHVSNWSQKMSFTLFLELQTTSCLWCLWMFGLNNRFSHVKISNHPFETSRFKWFFEVAGVQQKQFPKEQRPLVIIWHQPKPRTIVEELPPNLFIHLYEVCSPKEWDWNMPQVQKIPMGVVKNRQIPNRPSKFNNSRH